MEIFQGKPIFEGIAIGPIKYRTKIKAEVHKQTVSDTAAEISRFHEARAQARDELKGLYERALSSVGKSGSAIFEAYQLLLADEEYVDAVCKRIAEDSVNAEYAILKTSASLEKAFAGIEDEYISARADDIRDISERLIGILSGSRKETPVKLTEPVILFAQDLSPSDMIQLDRSRILALVLRDGSLHSHLAILAKSMEIPALTGIDPGLDSDGKTAAVNSFDGKLILSPTEEILESLQGKLSEINRKKEQLSELKGRETVTADGKKIDLFANVNSLRTLDLALSNDAEGIGLLRTEFLYLESENYPSEEMQFEAYKDVLTRMQQKKVVIRTLDIGADKQAPYFMLRKEENPAMGLRGIRLCLEREEMFCTQLRALLRASVYGNLQILFPMIISVSEVRQAKALLAKVRAQLEAEGLSIPEIPIGVMIETPAAVMISDQLAEEADFFSIGTNDLTQYTLAADRQNESIDRFIDPHHPAILRMISLVCENARKKDCRVAICGELGADLSLTEDFIKMGIEEFSVSPSLILPLRQQIRTSHA